MLLNSSEISLALNLTRRHLEASDHQHWQSYYQSGQLPAPLGVHVVTGTYFLVIGFFGTVGNAMLLWAFICSENLRSPSNLLVANLAVADLGLSVGTFPLLTISSFYEEWKFGVSGCICYGFMGALFGMMSIITMCSIAVDRCFSITKWTSWHLTYPRVLLWIAGIWTYAFLMAVPPLLGWSAYIKEGIQTSCTFDYLTRDTENLSFTLYLFIVGFILPVCIIIICYILIVNHITMHSNLMTDAGFGNDSGPRGRARTSSVIIGGPERSQLKYETKATMTCAVIVVVFCLAWTPYACVALIGTFGDQSLIDPLASSIPAFFAKASAIYNPIIYALMNERFRDAIMYALKLRAPPVRSPSFATASRRYSEHTRLSVARGSDPVNQEVRRFLRGCTAEA